jgi:hypothetical protein
LPGERCRAHNARVLPAVSAASGGTIENQEDQVKTTRHTLAAASAIGLLLLAGPALLLSTASPARAQAAGMGGIGVSDSITIRATVKSVDQKNRMVTLVGPQGNSVTLKVSDEVKNLAQVKPGSKVIAHYHASVAFVLAPPGTKLPDSSATTTTATAAPGQAPAGGGESRIIVSGVVVGVDQAAHTLQLVGMGGGRVRTIDVVTPEGQQALTRINVGDTITAIITESLLVAVEPAK